MQTEDCYTSAILVKPAMETDTTGRPLQLFSSEWIELFAVLSLDLTEAFLTELAIPVNMVDLRQALKKTIPHQEGAYRDWPEAEDLTDQQWAAIRFQMSELETAIGHESGEALYHWANKSYVSRDQRRWKPYQQFMREWATTWSEKQEDLIKLQNPQPIADLYHQSTAMGDIDMIVSTVRQAPLSTWDQYMFELRRYSLDLAAIKHANQDEDEYSVLRDPLDTIVSTIELNRFQRFWAAILPNLSAAELEALHFQATEAYNREVLAPRKVVLPAALLQNVKS